MNNSFLAVEYATLSEEPKTDFVPVFREKEEGLIKIITAIQGVSASKEWSTLKDKVFDALVKNLLKDIQDEARKETPDTLKLNRLSGELKWAEKFSDLKKLENVYRLELTNVRTKLYGKTD